MKKILILLLCLLLTASITGCGTQSIKPIDTIEGNMKTYSEMSDGTWQCDGHIYKYRLEISGRLSNAVKDSTYIYLMKYIFVICLPMLLPGFGMQVSFLD